MSNTAEQAELPPPASESPAPSRARVALIKRLADVVSLPSSRVNAFERAVTSDVLVDLLREADPTERLRVARRVASLADIPPLLVRLLLRDDIEIATPLLVESSSLGECDLIDCIRAAGPQHRQLIAQRRGLTESVTEALVLTGETQVVEAVLRNPEARLSHPALEAVVMTSRSHLQIVTPLLKRAELRPSQAYLLFWWADAAARKVILQRFAVSREVLQEITAEVFPLAAAEGWRDAASRKALQFIERRQRNRAAIERSPYGSLDEAVAAAEAGMTPQVLKEIAFLAGIKPMTAAKIVADPGGEPMAILCKATGLQRQSLGQLWRAMRRPDVSAGGAPAPDFERVVVAFDAIAVDRAQTVLRYWNWSLSSAMSPALLEAIRSGDEGAIDAFSTPERSALLAFASDFDD
ncbi:MAG: DUF2336 domain-containing protein [Caulobacteraceae bacterium]